MVPVGSIFPYYGLTEPNEFWLICDGRDTTGTDIELATHYPQLYAILGNTNVLPDMRECTPVMIGQSDNNYDETTNPTGIHSHDIYTLGEFKDDQIQEHQHGYNYTTGRDDGGTDGGQYWRYGPSTFDTYGMSSGTRYGSTTHGKQFGLNFIIKAKTTVIQ